MTRLIDADALLEALEIEIHKKYPFSLKDLITNSPTVEQGEPVVLKRDYNFMRDLAIGCEDAWNKLHEQKPITWTKQSELDKTTTLRNPIVMWKNKYKSIKNNIPLYTSPQKQWVGLSDLKISKIIGAEWWKEKHKFAKAIEAKLKELNYD